MTRVVVPGTPNTVIISDNPRAAVRVTQPEAAKFENFTWSSTGYLQPILAPHRLYAEVGYSIDSIRISVDEAADAEIVVDILKNGTSIFPDPARRPVIDAGEYTGTADCSTTSLTVAKGDYLQVQILQAGTVQKGRGLIVAMRLKVTNRALDKVILNSDSDPYETLVFSTGGLQLGPIGSSTRIYPEGDYFIESIRASVGTPSSGTIILDVLKNDVTIFPGAKMEIPVGHVTKTITSGFFGEVTHGDFISVSVLATGLAQTGGGLTVTMRLKRLQ